MRFMRDLVHRVLMIRRKPRFSVTPLRYRWNSQRNLPHAENLQLFPKVKSPR